MTVAIYHKSISILLANDVISRGNTGHVATSDDEDVVHTTKCRVVNATRLDFAFIFVKPEKRASAKHATCEQICDNLFADQ